MSLTENHNIIFQNKLKNDIPPQLEAGEIAFAHDGNEIVIGNDHSTGNSTTNRMKFPFNNTLIFTEKSQKQFNQIQADYLKNSGKYNYHEAILLADRLVWTDVGYNIPVSNGVSATIEYSVCTVDGSIVKSGNLNVMYVTQTGQLGITDTSNSAKDVSLSTRSAFDPFEVYGRIQLQFTYDGGNLKFQYKNFLFEDCIINFRTSNVTQAGYLIVGGTINRALPFVPVMVGSLSAIGFINTSMNIKMHASDVHVLEQNDQLTATGIHVNPSFKFNRVMNSQYVPIIS